MNNVSAALLPLVQYHIQARERVIKNISEADLAKKLHPDVSSAGFLLTHMAETSLYFSLQLFEGASDFMPKYGAKVVDTGQDFSLEYIRETQHRAYDLMLKACETLKDADWALAVPLLPFSQSMVRSTGLGIVLMHNQHHLGQISQALRHG